MADETIIIDNGILERLKQPEKFLHARMLKEMAAVTDDLQWAIAGSIKIRTSRLARSYFAPVNQRVSVRSVGPGFTVQGEVGSRLYYSPFVERGTGIYGDNHRPFINYTRNGQQFFDFGMKPRRNVELISKMMEPEIARRFEKVGSDYANWLSNGGMFASGGGLTFG